MTVTDALTLGHAAQLWDQTTWQKRIDARLRLTHEADVRGTPQVARVHRAAAAEYRRMANEEARP